MDTKPGAFKPKYDVEYVFRIRREATGPFKNLWRLDVKGPGDEKEVMVVDADALNTVISKVGYVFEQDNY